MSENLKEQLLSATSSFVENITLEQLQMLGDKDVHQCFEALLKQVKGHAGAVWIKQEIDGNEALTIAYNVGGQGSEIEGAVSQSLDSGLVSKAFREKELICHQGLFQHPEKTANVDRELGQVTVHQIAAPFSMFGKTIGAMTVIQTLEEGVANLTEWGFDENDVEQFRLWSNVIQKLFEHNFVRKTLAT